ncbi:unnamed protein product [Acanthoscelides obtectus]|uniref:HAT C-terminal dimerisation domain-containing protein n=1 Tax=Acanthoscelides obtectus TaxID=200917 RepID=A0A9P0VTS0_ACAOB|nr:unnamed protein product [Acanthoscelides obtectus]CAH2020082.1 unnamed protein product [Acanthoscelides obtectus]CAH2020090.1 unnamed protein product [Acanthoscelides obtectus]CAH2020117.1 unnamed protein product [Acanthoscelides obtectus]CAH2020121.1 unnamed protein product [Acanthoscelides obtectus]
MEIQHGLPELKVKQDVATRWNSTFDMFKRILEIKQPLMSVIAIHYKNLPNLSNTDMKILEICCQILKVFKEVTDEISSEKEQFTFKYCRKFLVDNPEIPEECKQLTEALLSSLQKRFSNIEFNKMFAEATILDPRLKKFGFDSKTAFECAKKNLISYVTRNTPSSSEVTKRNDEQIQTDGVELTKKTTKSAIWESFDWAIANVVSSVNPLTAGIIEVEKYLDEPLLQRDCDPFMWWEQRKHVYPRLYVLMKSRLSIVATSVPSERIFSKAGQTLTEKRSSRQGQKVSMLLFWNSNL